MTRRSQIIPFDSRPRLISRASSVRSSR